MNMQREVQVSYHTVPLLVVGYYDAEEEGVAAQLIIQKVLAGAVDILPLLSVRDEDALEALALLAVGEGR